MRAADLVPGALVVSWDATGAEIRELALSLPEAWEDFPWGESVVKVRKKVFVFLGHPDGAAFAMTVKLPESGPGVLSEPWAEPSGYGLGRSGWVSIHLRDGHDPPPLEEMREWVLESYSAVAPKSLVAKLDLPPAR